VVLRRLTVKILAVGGSDIVMKIKFQIRGLINRYYMPQRRDQEFFVKSTGGNRLRPV